MEMSLPGGTLLALLLFLWQRKKPDIGRSGNPREARSTWKSDRIWTSRTFGVESK